MGAPACVPPRERFVPLGRTADLNGYRVDVAIGVGHYIDHGEGARLKECRYAVLPQPFLQLLK
jgi:hypothetical protein